jgi:glycosyltransferase involved in cell wall biosynthesis
VRASEPCDLRILFFGQLAKIWSLRGKPTPSTVVRCSYLSGQLEALGFTCSVRYRKYRELSDLIGQVRTSDVVVFHNLQFPMTTKPEPPIELLLHMASRSARKITIFDMDDAIFTQYPILTEFFVARSDLVTVGSHQLAVFARKWNKHVHILPSPVETELFSPSVRNHKRAERVVLGWHGTAYNQLGNLRLLVPVLRNLATRHDITLKLLGTMGNERIQRMFSSIKDLEVDFGPNSWIPYDRLPFQLADVDIGLSPLDDTLWCRGKCAMKALEYMGMGIPVVGSAVGEHNYIIRDGANGFLASTEEEWDSKIEQLMENDGLRSRIGREGRKTVTNDYSLPAVAERFASILADQLRPK